MINNIIKNYQKYRWFFTSSGKLVIGGKSAEQNEKLLTEIIKNKKNYIVMHTSNPGSPFSIIISDIKNITEEDLKQASIFTACFSQEWKKNKKKAKVDIFELNQIGKKKNMKTGTFGVIGKINNKTIELKLYLIIQNEKLRAVGFKTGSFILTSGKTSKEKAVDILSKKLKISKQEIEAAIPSGRFSIKCQEQ
ncbi:MAG: NFACT RNA binding domain-containing protein [Nanoarchaeota archaeon]